MNLQETAGQILRERLFETPDDIDYAKKQAIDMLAEDESLPRAAAVALIFKATEELENAG